MYREIASSKRWKKRDMSRSRSLYLVKTLIGRYRHNFDPIAMIELRGGFGNHSGQNELSHAPRGGPEGIFYEYPTPQVSVKCEKVFFHDGEQHTNPKAV